MAISNSPNNFEAARQTPPNDLTFQPNIKAEADSTIVPIKNISHPSVHPAKGAPPESYPDLCFLPSGGLRPGFQLLLLLNLAIAWLFTAAIGCTLDKFQRPLRHTATLMMLPWVTQCAVTLALIFKCPQFGYSAGAKLCAGAVGFCVASDAVLALRASGWEINVVLMGFWMAGGAYAGLLGEVVFGLVGGFERRKDKKAKRDMKAQEWEYVMVGKGEVGECAV